MRLIFSILVINVFCNICTAQQDSSHYPYWSKPALGLRVATGYQKTIYMELGAAYHRAGGDITSPVGQCIYGSFEYIPSILPVKTTGLFGVKIGAEYAGHLSVYGAEIKYMTDFNGQSNYIFTPKIGMGIWTMAGIMYGYNINLSDRHVPYPGNHQFSIVVNIDRLLLEGF